MKAVMKIFWMTVLILLLAGCGNAAEESTPAEETDSTEQDTNENASKEEEEADMPNGNDVPSKENEAVEPDSTASDASDSDALSQYSSEEIEFARVWLQLGPNQDIDGLYVKRIPAGTLLNPDDETSGTYTEPVIQLAGSRLVDGSVTYSGNGDGTINVYNVPLRWDGQYPAGEAFYTEIIENTELVPVDVGEDEEVVRLIELLKEQP